MFGRQRRRASGSGFGGPRRSRRRFSPSLDGAAAGLEDRQLLSAGATAGEAVVISGGATSLTSSRDTSPSGRVVIDDYETILLRTPTQAEVNRLAPELSGGALPRAGLKDLLLDSSEHQQLLASMGVDLHGSSKAFVSSLYANVLHETPSARDYNLWVRRIDGGMSREAAAQAFIRAAEARTGVTNYPSPTTPTITIAPTPTTTIAPTPTVPTATPTPTTTTPTPTTTTTTPTPTPTVPTPTPTAPTTTIATMTTTTPTPTTTTTSVATTGATSTTTPTSTTPGTSTASRPPEHVPPVTPTTPTPTPTPTPTTPTPTPTSTTTPTPTPTSATGGSRTSAKQPQSAWPRMA